MPPDGWFYGIARTLFDIYRQGLVDLGLTVFDVPVDAFLPPDAVRIAALLSDLKAFRPEIALGLSYGSYALICRLPARRDGSRPNLFTDVLDIPTICLWDHAPVELADQLLCPHPPDPAASNSGAMSTLRDILTHPRLIHWSRDSGQTKIMRGLGLLRENRLIEEMPPSLPGFSPAARLNGSRNGWAAHKLARQGLKRATSRGLLVDVGFERLQERFVIVVRRADPIAHRIGQQPLVGIRRERHTRNIHSPK